MKLLKIIENIGIASPAATAVQQLNNSSQSLDQLIDKARQNRETRLAAKRLTQIKMELESIAREIESTVKLYNL